MDRTVVEADTRLDDLIARAEAGEEVVVIRGDKSAVKLTTERVEETPSDDERRAAFIARLDAISQAARAKATPGPDAAHSQDFLYDDMGLPA